MEGSFWNSSLTRRPVGSVWETTASRRCSRCSFRQDGVLCTQGTDGIHGANYPTLAYSHMHSHSFHILILIELIENNNRDSVLACVWSSLKKDP